MVSLGGLARKIFGSSNDRRVKATRPQVEAINAMEDETAGALRRRAARPHRPVPAANSPTAPTLDDLLVPAFATVREAARRVLGMRPFDVQLIGGMVLHERRHRRNAHRRGQDAGRHAARLSQRARRQGRARRHRQRLSRQARLRMDGPRLQVPRPDRRRHRPRPDRRPAPRRLCLRRHLRHQQRARLRLSARQHEVRARPDGAARPQLRDRRRGRIRSWSTRRARR